MKVFTKELVSYLDTLLQTHKFRDYAPNGLQVEGCSEISTIVTGVTASQALIDRAIELEADALLVHHGYFWKNESPCVVGMKQRRLKALLMNDINMLGYHLPLDAHPELGNNAQLAMRLGVQITGGLEVGNPLSVGNVGTLAEPITAQAFADRVGQALGRQPILVEAGERWVRTVGLCTGGAQGYIDQAIEQGVDLYLSGEISESTTHTARESGIHYIAAGHHATERYGAKALGEHLAEKFGLVCHFVDIDNPA